MTVFETKKGTKVIRLDNPRCFCYLILVENQVILIDTGIAGNLKMIEKQINQAGVDKVDAIIQTHHHTDHTENTAYFESKYHCPVYIHESESDYLRQGYCILPKGTSFSARMICRVEKLFHVFEHFNPVQNVTPIDFDHSIFPEGITLLATPGHSSGSTSVIVDNEIACVGDNLIHMSKKIYPPFADDEKLLVESWGILLGTTCSLFFPAHGKEVTKEYFHACYERLIHKKGN